MLHPRALNDLRIAGIHEAGHCAVARHFGIEARWKVRPSGTDSPETERLFVGDCWAWPPGGRWQNADVERAFYLAGLIAEVVLENNGPVPADQLYGRIETGVLELSGPDAAGARGFTVSDIESCQLLVLDLWEKIIKDADGMVLTVIDAAEREATERKAQ